VIIMSLYLLVGHLSILITEHLGVSRLGFVSSHSHSKFGLLYKMSVYYPKLSNGIWLVQLVSSNLSRLGFTLFTGHEVPSGE
jgi:hypothetical protein